MSAPSTCSSLAESSIQHPLISLHSVYYTYDPDNSLDDRFDEISSDLYIKTMIIMLTKFLPIFLLLTLGIVVRKAHLFQEGFIDDLKKLVINVVLPSILFLSFLTMELKISYIALFISTILFCFILYAAGLLLRRANICAHPYSEFFYTGFEFGMVGIALFTSMFGQEKLYAILLLDLGHELFIWFFYAPALQFKQEKTIKIGSVLRSFSSSPIIIAIISALFLNSTNLYVLVQENLIITAIIQTLHLIAAMTSPLILLVIGYQLQFKRQGIFSAFKLIGLRLLIVGIFGTAFIYFTNAFILPVDSLMLYAFITFLILPPPFIIPLFLPKKAHEENIFYNNALVLYTLIMLILYSIIMLLLS